MQEGESTSKKEKTKDLTNIPSIGNLTAKALEEADFDSIPKLKEAEIEELNSIEHIGENLAKKILKEVRDPLDDQELEEDTKLEIRCPVCDKFTEYEREECEECEESIELFSSVVLPGQGLIKNPKKTLAEVEKQILNNGEDAESWFIRGSILECMGANRKALESFDRVIELDPLFDHIWNAKAKVSLKIGEIEDAAKAYKLAFDAQKAPRDLAEKIEELDTSTSKEAIELGEKNEIDKKLDEKITKARNLLGELEDEGKEIEDLTSKLDTVTEERIKGNKEKAIDMVGEVIEKIEYLSEEEIKDFSNKLEELDDFSKELSKEIRKMIGIDDAISIAKEAKEKEDFERASEILSRYLKNKSSLVSISKNLNEIISMKSKLEDLDVDEAFLDDINKDFEKIKELCRNKEFKNAEDLLENLMENLEERLEYVERIKEQYIKEIEGIIEKGEKNGFSIEKIKENFNEIKKRFRTGEKNQEEIINRFETIKQNAQKLLSVKSNISKVEDRLSGYEDALDTNRYEQKIEEIEEILKKDNFEKAMDLSKKLKNHIKTEIKNLEEEERLKKKSGENLAEARKKLSKLRDTDFELDEMKRLLKNANKAKKKGELQKSIEFTDKFIDSADKMIELSDLVENINKKIEKLDEKDLINKERINYEIDQYKRLIKVEKYELAEKFLVKTLKKIEEALDEENMIPPPEAKLDETATEIPTQIKEKVRNVKELNNLVERAKIEIKVNREPLKDAIIKIKDLEYKEANKILTDWKESLIDRLNYELGGRLDELDEKYGDLDIPSIQRRGEAVLQNIERRWSMRAYEGALETLIYASSFVQKVQKKDTKRDKELYLISELMDDLEGLDGDHENIKKLLSEAKDTREEELYKEKIKKIEEKIEKDLSKILDEELENIEERLEHLSHKDRIVALSNIIDVKLSLDEDNVEKASWYMREYKNSIKEV